ncbi:uncharacterized protein LTR77_006120 [Saxophila tyrrhenica]|uniref:Integral membrane bound transporter domain-containing protein n=1 Tax=Saxophila tyrrhenica TaxID=1690608 RepID=A0AAV9P6Z7_9PEZI|nr:hypothetical protein LTR77_006120 [Saxophila tyrrhenica]
MSTNGSATGSASSAEPRPGRFLSKGLRRATWISPRTGERSKRVFTLREASHRSNGHADDSETTPLLGGSSNASDGSSKSARAVAYLHKQWSASFEFLNSKTGRGIFKCSLAYLLGSLVTFVPQLAAIIGSGQDSKHMVATVTVWFHPARTVGSMHLATILALLGFLYSGVVGFTSMAVSMFFGSQDLLVVGHALVLVIWIGAGLGFVAWTKQHFGDPIVNVACSLASLGCITVLIKEGAVQAGEFSDDRVVQVLLMVLMGIIVTTAVNTLVLPVTARSQLRDDLEKNTDLLGELLIAITRAFLSGREHDLQDSFFEDLQKEHQQSLQKMSKDLGETKNEFRVLGREQLFEVSTRLVHCLEGLSQDLGGLRSAALAQFAFLHPSEGHGSTMSSPGEQRAAWISNATNGIDRNHMPNILDVIAEAPEENSPPVNGINNSERRESIASIASNIKGPDDMFFTFITQLGPPTKSLVYTLKQILDELPFTATEESSGFLGMFRPKFAVAVNDNFHSSLNDAIALYGSSRREALNVLYASRALNAAFMPQSNKKANGAAGGGQHSAAAVTSSPFAKSGYVQPPEELIADMEEVSAVCGNFSFSLLDFAEDVLTYLSILDELKGALEHPSPSWHWLRFWKLSWKHDERKTFALGSDSEHGLEHGVNHNIPEPIRKADEFVDPEKPQAEQPWTWWAYRKLRVFRRDDIRFAIKVGIGAMLYSLPAFLRSTRATFVYWRGEWGLVSYMAVCCMTIGAANTTGMRRFIGTFIGACLAIVAWVISSSHGEANPYLLAFFGWIVSTGCFYLILGRGEGPLGRFILLTYNLGALYAYSLSVHDDDHDDDEGGIDPAIFDIVLHRMVAVIVGTIWAIVVCRVIWPISARQKLKDGPCILWLRMALVWKRDPLALLLLGEPRSSYMDIREEAELHSFLSYLDSIRGAASSEFQLRGPFRDKPVSRIIERTRRMLDAFHTMNVVISKNLQWTPGEAAVLRYTREQRFALSARISHLFSVLASSYKLEFPLGGALPSIENSRDRLLARISEFRRNGEGRETATEQDYELLYAYVLVTGQLARDIEAVEEEIEGLFGRLNEENLKLQ